MKALFEKLLQTRDLIYWLIAFLITSAEIVFAFLSVTIGVLIHSAILILLLMTAFTKFPRHPYPLYLALVLIPLIRIISVSLPRSDMPEVLVYAAVGVPLFIAGATVAKILGITPAAIGFRLDKFYKQLLIAFIGFPLGYLEFYTHRLTLKDAAAAPDDIFIWVITFIIWIGLLEEFLFRGLLFYTAAGYLGRNKAMVFTSMLYAAMTVSAGSFFSVIFAFLISLLFCGLFVRYKSILGISFAHGLINITLSILCPLINI